MPGAPKIYFNGCSQIENGHLELETKNWEEQSWPWLIANSLNAKYRNDAISLGSNNRLLRTTIDAVLEYNPDIVVAGITDANRIELPIANGDRCRININNCNTDNGSVTEQFQKYWYVTHHNNWLSFCTTLQIVYQLKCLQQVHGFRLYLLNTVCDNYFSDWESLLQQDSFFNKYNRAPWRIKKEQADIQRLIDQVADLNWIIPWTDSLQSTVLDRNLETDLFGHPALESQMSVYNLLKGKII